MLQPREIRKELAYKLLSTQFADWLIPFCELVLPKGLDASNASFFTPSELIESVLRQAASLLGIHFFFHPNLSSTQDEKHGYTA